MAKKKKNKKGRRDSENENQILEGKCSHVKDCVKSSNLTKVIPHADLLKCQECLNVVPEKNKTTGDKKVENIEGRNELDVTQTEEKTDICVCLRCGNIACSRQSTHQHAVEHYNSKNSHPLVVNLSTWVVWCYKCDDEVDIETNPALGECQGILKKALGVKAAKQEKHEKPPKKTNSNIYSCAGNMQKVKGLTNLGNTCFFNSVMQNLCQTQLLRVSMNHLMLSDFEYCVSPSGDSKDLGPLSVTIMDKPGPLTSALAKFLQDMTSEGKKNVVSPGYLFTEICKKAPRFKGFRQQDSQELLRYLLDSVRTEEIKNVKRAILHSYGVKSSGKEGLSPDKVDEDVHEKIKAYGRNARAPVIDTLFGGQLVSSVECRTCHKVSTIMESFFDLSLSLTTINNTVSIQVQGNTAPKKKQTAVPVDNKKNATKNTVKDTEVKPKPAPKPSKHQLKKKAKEAKKEKKKNRKRLNSGSIVDRKQSGAEEEDEIEDHENSETPNNDVSKNIVHDVTETSVDDVIPKAEYQVENANNNEDILDVSKVRTAGTTDSAEVATVTSDELLTNDSDKSEENASSNQDSVEFSKDGTSELNLSESHAEVDESSGSKIEQNTARNECENGVQDLTDLGTAGVSNGGTDESNSECGGLENKQPSEYSSQECITNDGGYLESSESNKNKTCNDEDLGKPDVNEISSDNKLRDSNDRDGCVDGIDGQDCTKKSLLQPNGENLVNSIEKQERQHHTSTRPQKPINKSYDVEPSHHISEMTDQESFIQNKATDLPPNFESKNSSKSQKINEYVNQLVNDALELAIRDILTGLLSTETLSQEENHSPVKNTTTRFTLGENDNVHANESTKNILKDSLHDKSSSLLSEKDESIPFESQTKNANGESNSAENSTEVFPLKKNDNEHVFESESVQDNNKSSSLLSEKDESILCEGQKMNEEYSSLENSTEEFPRTKNDNEHVLENESVEDIPKHSFHNISSSLLSEKDESIQKMNEEAVQNTTASCQLEKNDSEEIFQYAKEIVNEVIEDSLHSISSRLLAEEAQARFQDNLKVEVDHSNKMVEDHGSSAKDDNEKILEYVNGIVNDAIKNFLYDISISLLVEVTQFSSSGNAEVQNGLSYESDKIKEDNISSSVHNNTGSSLSNEQTDATNAPNSQNGIEMTNINKTIEINTVSSENDDFSQSNGISTEGTSEYKNIEEGTSECKNIGNGMCVNSKNIESISGSVDKEISASGDSSNEDENEGSGSEILCGNHSLGSMENIKSNVMTVESCLKKFCSPEILDGNNKFICDECNRTDKEVLEENDEVETEDNEKETSAKKKTKRKPVFTEAVKQLLINQAPPILTLHLKRFQQVGYSLKKIPKHVDFPLVLDLAPFCHKSGKLATDAEGKVMYALCGIVEHSGSLHSGHYTACCRVPTVPSSLFETKFENLNQMLKVMEQMWTQGGNRDSYVHEGPSSSRWFHISDSHVSEVGLERVLKAQAYLLFYERMVLSHGGNR